MRSGGNGSLRAHSAVLAGASSLRCEVGTAHLQVTDQFEDMKKLAPRGAVKIVLHFSPPDSYHM